MCHKPFLRPALLLCLVQIGNRMALNQLILALTEDNEIDNRYAWLNERLYRQLETDEIYTGLDKAEA